MKYRRIAITVAEGKMGEYEWGMIKNFSDFLGRKSTIFYRVDSHFLIKAFAF